MKQTNWLYIALSVYRFSSQQTKTEYAKVSEDLDWPSPGLNKRKVAGKYVENAVLTHNKHVTLMR